MKIIKIIMINILLTYILFFNNTSYSKNNLSELFLFLGGGEARLYKDKFNNECVSGAQIIYSWKQLEPKKDVYDFTKIKDDLLYLNKIHKKLFIQLQDRSFEPVVFNVPNYIREDKIYHGGVAMQYDFPGEGKPIATGWVARVWDPAVRGRFQLLIKKLAREFDGKIYGINLPETAVDFDENNLPEGFTKDKYFYVELENILALKKAFHKSIVVQYVNFFPGEWSNDHRYMSRLFSFAVAHQIGLGGPDVVPYKMAQMKNSYPFFHKFKKQLSVSMAIQEPDYTYKNPETREPYTFIDFYNFTQNYLGANIIFWNVQEPFYSNQLIPKLNPEYFVCHGS
jgi:hypothetical protein